MKKTLGLVILFIVGGIVGYLVFDAAVPESVKIRGQMRDLLDKSNEGDHVAMFKYDHMKLPLAAAYNSENKPDEAIAILTELIKKNSDPRDFAGQKRKKIHADYFFEARYYEELAKSFALKGDSAGQEKALKKSKAAQAMEERLAPKEEKREKIRQLKENAAL